MRNTNLRPVTPGMPGSTESLWLVGGHVVDVIRTTVRRDTNVEVFDGLIREITDTPPPAGAASIDLGGRYLVPGLVSVHTHLTIVYPFDETDVHETSGASALRGASRARDALLAGVTTVRTLDEQNQADIVIRQAVAEGWLDAPRIFASGRALGITGGHGKGMACVYADGHDEFLKAARTELEAGADHIKVFISGGIAHADESFNGAQMTRDEMRAVVRATSEQGTYVAAHAGGGDAIREAISVGITAFEHGYDLDDATVEMMAEHRAYLTPTLSVTSCPEWMRAHGFTEWQIELAMRVHPTHLASIQRAFGRAIVDPAHLDDDGIRIVAGTDYLPGEPNDGTSCAVKEMELLEQAGLPVGAALRAGTWEAARLLRAADRFGSIAEGLAADLVVTAEDPTITVSALRTIGTVIQGGRVVRSDLDALATSGTGARQ
ncbi:metal-dependent hydrolase family protein [Agromyces aerolatus]|uniref:metal-dependent hydrolase family protein n=1 Tax=Agromyces sp. LY-1074 TaxID=3074080 RepID=UPI0028668DF7|nr:MULTISPECIES: amidohydrolase family protein [unclassified Agromyces]MDR5699039.1 amidohydrolase family protein [Agromyces sp. LY-1074]MDR5705183.1 amidohydrolase family protein [Agromyces sp. LY-1358]